MDKRPEKMTEQDELLELQERVSEEARKFDLMTIVVFLLIIAALGVMIHIIPDKAFSEQENRALQLAPTVSAERIFDGRFTADVSKYYADQFPARDFFVGLKSISELALLKGENKDVVLGRNDYLVKRQDYPDFDTINANIAPISDFADEMNKLGVPFNVAIAGRPEDVLGHYLPASYPKENSEAVWEKFSEICSDNPNMGFINLRDPLKAIVDSGTGEQLYYKTDHHWTTLGAHYAYLEILKSFGVEESAALSLLNVNAATAADGFYGTTWSRACFKWIPGEHIQVFRYQGDDSVYTTTITDGNGKQNAFNGFYVNDFAHKKDKYSLFLGGNNPRVDVVKTNEKKRPKLLIVKDSFANSIAPMLAYNYDLIIIDLRYYADSIKKIIVEERVDRVLVLNYLGTLTEGSMFGTIKVGINGTYIPYELPPEPTVEYQIKDLYINSNRIDDYKIVCPASEDFYNSAEELQKQLLDKTGCELEIVSVPVPPVSAEGVVATDYIDVSSYEKSFILCDGGLPSKGLLQIKVEGSNMVFKCTMKDGISYAVKQFISKYIKNGTGRINFGEDYVYSDISDESIIIMPK